MELPKTALPIKGARDHWIDIDGSVYAIDHRPKGGGRLIRKALNTSHGYKYCGIYYPNKGCVSKRVHRLVAEAFIPNPDKLPIVGHRNNIKSDNRVDNLYWTTNQENTQKAYDDGLAHNDIGFDDSQSMPVAMFDALTNKRIATYGSVSRAHVETGISKNTILRQARYKRPIRKPFYFRFVDDERCEKPDLVGMFDYDTDQLLSTYINKSDASRKTGVGETTIAQQCRCGKPTRKFSEVYFGIVSNN